VSERVFSVSGDGLWADLGGSMGAAGPNGRRFGCSEGCLNDAFGIGFGGGNREESHVIFFTVQNHPNKAQQQPM
jgi:hypothetical protein